MGNCFKVEEKENVNLTIKETRAKSMRPINTQGYVFSKEERFMEDLGRYRWLEKRLAFKLKGNLLRNFAIIFDKSKKGFLFPQMEEFKIKASPALGIDKGKNKRVSLQSKTQIMKIDKKSEKNPEISSNDEKGKSEKKNLRESPSLMKEIKRALTVNKSLSNSSDTQEKEPRSADLKVCFDFSKKSAGSTKGIRNGK